MIGKSEKRLGHPVKCGICHMEIVDRAQIYQAGLNLGVVCSKCYKKFSVNDLEMMANMFIAYGGYFGMLREAKFSFLRILEKILEEFHEGDAINSEQLNIKLMHKALLHGISPEKYVDRLNLLVRE